jgi:hypothetical protein
MEILTLRDPSRGDSTSGYTFVNGAFFCHLLEDVVREPKAGRPTEWGALVAWVKTWKIDKITAIPFGRYQTIINMSNRFKRLMPLLLGVPAFDGVRMHPGLKPEDTEACLLPGDELYETDAGPRVKSGTTRPAAERLQTAIQEALDRGEEVWWEFKENPA